MGVPQPVQEQEDRDRAAAALQWREPSGETTALGREQVRSVPCHRALLGQERG